MNAPTNPAAPRLDYASASPKGLAALMGLERHVRASGLDHGLLELVKLRASQINGCAFCIDMHTKEATAAGESAQRLHGLVAWREAPYYDARERAALAWTEALTHVADHAIDDALYEELRAHFDETQTVDLTLAVIAINGWNRLSIGFAVPAGGYEVGAF